MKIYVAAPWVHKDTARATAAIIEAAGHTITEPWWDQVPSDQHEELAQQAHADIVGVASADALIVLQLAQSEGKAVETGMAIAWMKAIVVVNPSSQPDSNAARNGNIFHHLMTVVPTVEDALDKLKGFEAFLAAAAAQAVASSPVPQGDGDGR